MIELPTLALLSIKLLISCIPTQESALLGAYTQQPCQRKMEKYDMSCRAHSCMAVAMDLDMNTKHLPNHPGP